jgi:serine/threonine protein kinase/Tfp pilus assembly protein PilF
MSEQPSAGAVSGEVERLLAEAVAEITDRLHAGELVDVREHLARHPELADQLRPLLGALDLLARFSSSAGRDGPPTRACAAEELSGTLGDYRILREVGRGGMGVVYEAEQISLGRRVALKVLPFAATMDPRHLTRFHNEARAAACLHHGHIVPVFAVGCERGVHFYAMQLIDGQTLAEAIRALRREAAGVQAAGVQAAAAAAGAGEPTTPHLAGAAATAETPARVTLSTEGLRRGRGYYRKVAELGAQAAEALDYAHERGVIHRDVKPANLLLDGYGALWVTDFGLAHLQHAEGSLTMTGDLVGTLRYMSPEQALARRGVVDHRTDVYSLGATLYELLALRPAFDGQDRQELLRQIAFEEPLAPRKLDRGIPAELETIVLKAMEKNPAQRYGTAQELADDLQRYLNNEPIRARRPSLRQVAVKWARRRPAVAALAVMIVLAVAGALTAAVLFGLYANQRSRLLLLALERHGEAEALLGEGIEAGAAGHFVEAESKMERALATLGAESEEDPTLLRERIGDRLGRVRRQRQQMAEEELTRRQLQEEVARLGRERHVLLDRVLSVVESEQKTNRTAILDLAPAVLRRFHLSPAGSAEEAARAFAPLSPYFQTAQQRLQVAERCCEVLLVWADAGAASGQHRDALRLLDQAEALGRAEGVPAMRVLHQRRALSLAALKDEAAAERERRRAAALTPAVALDHFLLALESYRQKGYEEAQRRAAEALRLQPGEFWPQYLIALCHLQGKRWAAADAWLTGCLIRRPDFFWPRLLRATARIELKDGRSLEGAEGDLVQAQRQGQGNAGAYVVAMARGRLAEVRGELAEARVHYHKAMESQAPGDYQAHTSLAEVQRKMKNLDAALAELYRAIERAPGEPRLYHTRGLLQRRRGDQAAARRDFERAIALGTRGREAWLASAFVELGDLKHRAGEHQAALMLFDAALKVVRNFPPAYRQRAETLLKLDRSAEAGKALDTFLAVGGKPGGDIYLARGLIHHELREHPRAIEAFTRALQWERGADVLSYRGWAYLKTQSLGMALVDFEEALKKAPRHGDALCGRGQVRVLQGKEREGIEDAEAALRHGKPTRTLLCCVARVYAWAARKRLGGERNVSAASRARAGQYEDRAAELVERAVRDTPPDQRQRFWDQWVMTDPALGAMRTHPRLTILEAGRTP